MKEGERERRREKRERELRVLGSYFRFFFLYLDPTPQARQAAPPPPPGSPLSVGLPPSVPLATTILPPPPPGPIPPNNINNKMKIFLLFFPVLSKQPFSFSDRLLGNSLSSYCSLSYTREIDSRADASREEQHARLLARSLFFFLSFLACQAQKKKKKKVCERGRVT